VIVGFGMNDGKVAAGTMRGRREPEGVVLATAVFESSESFKLLRYLALLAKYRPPSFGDEIRSTGQRPEMTAEDEQASSMDARPPADYEKNVEAMVDLAADVERA